MKTLKTLILSIILLFSFNTKAVNHNLVLDPYGVVDMDNTGTYIGTTTSTYTVNIGDSLTFTSSFATQTGFKINTTNILYMTGSGTYYYVITALDLPSFNISNFLNPNGTGGLTLMGTIHVNCTSPTINVNNPTICSGNTTTLTATGTSTSYTWNNGQSTSSIVVTPTTTTIYTVTGVSGGCTTVVQTTVTVNDLPIVTLSSISPMCSNGSSVVLNGIPSNGVYSGTSVIGSSFDPSVSGVGTFTITYTYTDLNNCTNSDSQEASVSFCTGIDENTEKIQFNTFPNPVVDELTINGTTKLGQVSVFDITGKVLINEFASESDTKLDFSKFESGLYIVVVGNTTRKIIKQ